MSSGTQTTVIFACPKCGTAYQATQQQHPDDHSGSFKCQDCRTEVHAWSGIFSFFDWKAYEKIAENLHRAELMALERDTLIAVGRANRREGFRHVVGNLSQQGRPSWQRRSDCS